MGLSKTQFSETRLKQRHWRGRRLLLLALLLLLPPAATQSVTPTLSPSASAPPAPCICLSQLAQSLAVPRSIVPLSGGLTGLIFTRGAGAGAAAGAGTSWGAGGLNRCHAAGQPCATCPTCSQERKVGVF